MAAEREFFVNLTTPAMSILLDTYRNIRTPNRAAQYLQEPSDTGSDEAPPVTVEDIDILLWNKLGQDATLQLYFHDAGEVCSQLRQSNLFERLYNINLIFRFT
jgi:hypothetical protein